MQVVVQPHVAGPVHFGTCSRVRSVKPAPPAALTLTMLDARSDAEVMMVRDASRQIMMQLLPMPGFLTFQGAVVGRRLTTVTLWESADAARQVMREAHHKAATARMFGGDVGSAFHSSNWTLERLGAMQVRCESCGTLRDSEAPCHCGAPPEARPAFW
jgi:heme-degrading monooxygenase HmoA